MCSVIKYYDAEALFYMPGNRYCILTPNQGSVPPAPSNDGYTNGHVVLEMYTDGSYGPNEYSTQPQMWDPSYPHLPFIPRSSTAVGEPGLEVLWRPLAPDNYVRLHPNRPFYRISEPYERELRVALQPVLNFAKAITNDRSPSARRAHDACELARHSIIHLSRTDGYDLPTLVDLARGVKRSILECYGYILYGRRGPIYSAAPDVPPQPRDLVGVFAYNLETVRMHVSMGVPTWRVVEVARLAPDLKIRHRVPLTRVSYSAGAKRLIGHAYNGESYISKLFVANPSQGLYVPVEGTNMMRFGGSINAARVAAASSATSATAGGSGSSSGGVSIGGLARTYTGELDKYLFPLIFLTLL